jgi:hypothetical protein
MSTKVLGDFNLAEALDDPAFKEQGVRSFILDPIIKALGYTQDSVDLEKTVQMQVGGKKQPTAYFADYALKIEQCYSCIIEAKAPSKDIHDEEYVTQALSYAMHNTVRSRYFALCNGREFALYKTDVDRTLVLRFSLAELDQYWDAVHQYLAPENFQVAGSVHYEITRYAPSDFDIKAYCRKRLISEIPAHKQAAKRHYGVHGYFTRQSWDIVQAHIMNYSRPGDTVLDPFGGSGVTAIEALMLQRKAIHVDINPFANFLVESLVLPIN